MNPVVRTCLYFLSFFADFVSERTSTEDNPVLEVCYTGGRYVLNSKNVNYSYGGLHTVFQKAFKQFPLKRDTGNVLLLGFGAGSVAAILQEELKINCRITAVEIDPEVIRLGKKYFDTGRFRQLTLRCEDAYGFVMNSTDRFDAVIVDLFVDNAVPEQFGNESFLIKLNDLLVPGGTLYYNKVANTHNLNLSARMLHKKLRKIFEETIAFRTGENTVFVCRTLHNRPLAY